MKLLVLLALVSVASASLSADELRAEYAKAKAKFGRQLLSSGLQATDDKEHFLSFAKSANFVADHNKNDGQEWTAEINRFSLETEAERALSLGLNASSFLERRSLQKRFTAPARLVVRDLEKDYTDKLPAIKNQGSCGSCWTFGAVAALEYQINRDRTGTNMRALSEQQYLDCVYEGSRNGCNGGWPSDCYDWTRNNGNMIASIKTMPYEGTDGTCNTNVKTAISGFSVSGAEYLSPGDSAMTAAVADESIGVISVAIGVVDSFYSYSKGVYSGKKCDSINHAVDVVGYGELNGVGYWRVRNSWGSWGDAGYINMKRGLNGANVNMCSISSYGHYPLVSGADDGTNEDDEGDDDNDDGEEEVDTCMQTGVGRYPTGSVMSQPAFTTWSQCLTMCGASTGCKAVVVTPEAKKTRKCYLLSSDELTARANWISATMACYQEKDDEEKTDKVCTWRIRKNRKLNSVLSKLVYTLDECKAKCEESTDGCRGCSCKTATSKCQMNSVNRGKTNANFTSYTMKCE